MKRFHFRLARVLEMREHEVEACRVAFLAAQAELASAQGGVTSAQQVAAESTAALRERSAAGLSSIELLASQAGAGRRYAEIRVAEYEARREAGKVEAARSKLVEARMRARALEHLRERALEQHRAEVNRVEQAELDEVSSRTVRVALGVRR